MENNVKISTLENKFNVKELPQVSDFVFEKTNEQTDLIKENYRIIKDNALCILYFSINSNLSKPLTLYNLLFFVEISFKYYLINFSNFDISTIDNHKHRIYDLMESIKKVDDKINFDKLIYILKKFKNKDCKNLDFNKYYYYKYNREPGNVSLIMNTKLTQKDIKNIKEVIKWIKLELHI